MDLIGWSRKFEHYQAMTDVPARVRKTEMWYWSSLLVDVVIIMMGIWMMQQPDQACFGLFLALSGLVGVAMTKLWALIRLASYQIIMELQLRDRK